MNKMILRKREYMKEVAVMANMMYDYTNGDIPDPENTINDPELEYKLQELDAVGKIELLKSEIKWRKEKVKKINNLLKGA